MVLFANLAKVLNIVYSYLPMGIREEKRKLQEESEKKWEETLLLGISEFINAPGTQKKMHRDGVYYENNGVVLTARYLAEKYHTSASDVTHTLLRLGIPTFKRFHHNRVMRGVLKF
ncbi:MAG: hypothetical protein QXU98_12095 [Candidatus Parvarchaeota archaeon]